MSAVTVLVRWPLAPLLRAAGNPTINVLAARLGVSARTIWRWQHHGLTDQQADHAAIAIGYHPANICADWHNL